MYILPLKLSTQRCSTQAINASEHSNRRPHVCAPVCLSVSVCERCGVVLLVARLQDCVKAVCNKCAQASGPKKIYHKQEGRQKEEDGPRGSGVGKEMKERRKEMGRKGRIDW